MTNDFSLSSDDSDRRPSRPVSEQRRRQLREAQEARRQKLKAQGLSSFTFFLRADTADRLRQIGQKEGCDASDAVALAVAKYDDKSTDIGGMSAELVEALESMFPTLALPEALILAAEKHVSEVRRKRASDAKRRSAKPASPAGSAKSKSAKG